MSMDIKKGHEQMNVARYRHAKNVFELVIDSDKALDFREGKSVSMSDVVKYDKIFSDAKKGLEASEKLISEVFGTNDFDEIAKKILKHGEIQLTSARKAKMREEKLKQIVELIHSNGVDPRTHAPHPPARIEAAISETKVHIDEFKPVHDQLNDILKKLKPIIPIKFETKEIEVIIDSQNAGKCYSVVKGFGTTLKEEWLADGSWRVVLELSAGDEADFYDKLNSITHGNAECKVLRTK